MAISSQPDLKQPVLNVHVTILWNWLKCKIKPFFALLSPLEHLTQENQSSNFLVFFLLMKSFNIQKLSLVAIIQVGAAFLSFTFISRFSIHHLKYSKFIQHKRTRLCFRHPLRDICCNSGVRIPVEASNIILKMLQNMSQWDAVGSTTSFGPECNGRVWKPLS